jgi:hypothetical protein
VNRPSLFQFAVHFHLFVSPSRPVFRWYFLLLRTVRNRKTTGMKWIECFGFIRYSRLLRFLLIHYYNQFQKIKSNLNSSISQHVLDIGGVGLYSSLEIFLSVAEVSGGLGDLSDLVFQSFLKHISTDRHEGLPHRTIEWNCTIESLHMIGGHGIHSLFSLQSSETRFDCSEITRIEFGLLLQFSKLLK